MMTFISFTLALFFVISPFIIYANSARVARFIDSKIMKRNEHWAIVDTQNFDQKCFALVIRQLTHTHYEVKIYENYNLRFEILPSTDFEYINLHQSSNNLQVVL